MDDEDFVGGAYIQNVVLQIRNGISNNNISATVRSTQRYDGGSYQCLINYLEDYLIRTLFR